MKKNQWKESGKDLLCNVVGAFLQAVGTWCFIEPCEIAPGGVSGISLLIHHLVGIPIGTLSFLINIPLFVASYRMLDRRMTWKTIWTVAWMTIVLDGIVMPFFPQYIGDRLISSAFGGIFTGIGMVLFFRRGSTTGGGRYPGEAASEKASVYADGIRDYAG